MNMMSASIEIDCQPTVLHISELKKFIQNLGCAEQWKPCWDVYGQRTDPMDAFKAATRVVFFRWLVENRDGSLRESYSFSAVVPASKKDRHYAFHAASFEVMRVPLRGEVRPTKINQIPFKPAEVVVIPFVSAVKGFSGVTILRARITGGSPAPGVR